MAIGQEENPLLAEGGRQETSYRALHLLGQHTELWRAGVLIGIQEFPVQNPQVAIENLLDGCVPVFEVPKQEASGEGDKQKNNDQDGDDHLPLWAALLHLLGVHGREELHPFVQVVHVPHVMAAVSLKASACSRWDHFIQ